MFSPVADCHDYGLTKPEFGLIFLQNPEILGYRDTGQHKEIDAVFVLVIDYLSI